MTEDKRRAVAELCREAERNIFEEKMLLTLDEFVELRDEPVRQELINGEMILLPPPKAWQSRAAMRTYDYLTGLKLPVKVYPAMGFVLGDASCIQADVSALPGYALETLRHGYVAMAPLLAVEVVGPFDRVRDVRNKRQLYFDHGAVEVWVIDAEPGVLDVHRADGEGRWNVREPFRSGALSCEIDPAQFL
jgi:Uma2 family endonuclease